jgi:autotransporter-associated beta strand protein
VTAGSVDFASGKLNITGYTPNESSSSYPANVQTLITTTGGITNFPTTVTVANQATVDFLSARAFQDGNDVKVQTDLTWYSTDPSRKAHGDFTIGSGGTFTLGAVLADSTTNTNNAAGWDGKTLTKLGAGTLILTGNNTYTGGTNVNAGTVQVGHANALGTGTATVANGGTLDVNGRSVANNITLGGGSLVNNSTTAASLGNQVTLSANSKVGGSGNMTLGNIAGANGLEKTGTGTVTLNGTNAATSTTVSAGTLALRTSGSAGTGNVDIASGATLAVDGAPTVANNIANAGVVDIKQDTTLSGAISGAGTINVNADTTVNGAMTGFTGTMNVAAGNTLTGNAGSSTLNLNNSAVYDLGGANRSLGTLNGDAAALVALGANDLTINNGGTYGGTIDGTGDLNISTGGDFTLADGAKVTTTGTTTIANDATLQLTATADQNDAAFQGGSLVNDGTLKTHFSTYTIPAGDTVDVYLGNNIAYSGSGTDVTVANRLYKVIGGLTYDGSLLYYTLERNFAGELLTHVTPTIGPVIDDYVGGNDLIEHMLNNTSSDAELEKYIESAFGFANQSQAASILYGTWQGVDSAIYNRSQTNALQLNRPCPQNDLWITPLYGNNRGFRLSSGDFRYGFTNDQWGIGFGLDRFCQGTRLGVMGLVGGGRMVTSGELAKTWNSTDYGGVFVYANQKIHATDLLLSAGWIGQENSVRQAQLGGDMTGKMNSGLFSVSTQLTRSFRLGGGSFFMPHLGIEYGRYYQGGMNANWGGQTAFTNEKTNADLLVMPVGFRLGSDYWTGQARLTPTFRAQYIANLADVGTGYNVGMTGSPSTALMTAHITDRHAGEVGVGLGIARGQVTVAGDYGFMFSQHYQRQAASLTVAYRF